MRILYLLKSGSLADEELLRFETDLISDHRIKPGNRVLFDAMTSQTPVDRKTLEVRVSFNPQSLK
jgi:hypothetical protein